MELMDGSLEDLYRDKLKPKLEENKKEGMKIVNKYFLKILIAYSCCYLNNVVHKDLKPQNILIKKS